MCGEKESVWTGESVLVGTVSQLLLITWDAWTGESVFKWE